MQVVQKLRDATHCIHLQLHQHPLLKVLMSCNVTKSDIQRVQLALYGFWKPLQTKVNSDLTVSPISKWLENDLKLDKTELKFLPRCSEIPPTNSHDQCLGIAYVREGSLLGGQLIYKNLARRFPLDTHTLSYFAGRGQNTPQHWRKVIEYIEHECIDHEAACAAAVETFSCFEHWMDHCYEKFLSEINLVSKPESTI
tara:strand:- start:3029 stop:3619 length:591 start_codon:yes stop_codon:yes gene_type:complete